MASSSVCSFLGGVTTKAEAEGTSEKRRAEERAAEVKRMRRESKVEEREGGLRKEAGEREVVRGRMVGRCKDLGKIGGGLFRGREAWISVEVAIAVSVQHKLKLKLYALPRDSLSRLQSNVWCTFHLALLSLLDRLDDNCLHLTSLAITPNVKTIRHEN